MNINNFFNKSMRLVRFPIVVLSSLCYSSNLYIVDTEFFLGINLLLSLVLLLSTKNELYFYMFICLLVFVFFKISQKDASADDIQINCNTPSMNVLFYSLSIALPFYSKHIINLLPRPLVNFKLVVIAFLPIAITFALRLLYVVPTAAIFCNKKAALIGQYDAAWFKNKAKGVAFACVSDLFPDRELI